MTKRAAINIRVGRNLRALRRAAEMTQAEMSEKMGLSRISISNIECGKQGLSSIQITRFAKVLRVSPAEVLEGRVKR